MCIACIQWELYKDKEDIRKLLIRAAKEGILIDTSHWSAELQAVVESLNKKDEEVYSDWLKF